MTYNEIIKKAGKRINKHVFYIKNGTTTNVSDDNIDSIKFNMQSPIIGTSINGCELILKEAIEGDIYVQIEAKYGSYTATKTYGAFYLKEEPTYQAEKKNYIHKTYDGLIKSMVDYQPVNVNYPCTVLSFFQAVVSAVGYTTNISSLPNGTQQIQTDIFENIGYTYRDVLDDIAVANGVLFYVDGNEIKIATRGGDSITIDDDILKNQNIQFGEHFGAINTIVLSRSGESDNVYYPTTLPENPVEFKILDNQLMNENNRSDYLPALYTQLNGLEYDIYDVELTGWGELRPLQTVNFETSDNTYTSYIFNNEITLTDGYKQAIYNELPKETETDYKAASTTDKTINKAYIIVRKNEAEIESLAERVVDVSATANGTGSVTLENAHEGILHKLSISGQISLLFPSEDLYPSNDLYPLGSYLLIDDVKYKLDFDYLRYLSPTVYDEFIYEDGNCKIIRRVGIDENDQMYALENEVTEQREGVYLEVNSNSTIQLKSFTNAIYKVEYLLENVYTDNFATQVDVSSQITQEAGRINLEVSKKLDSEDFNGANILLEVNKDGSSAKINADKIALEGYTTINGNFKVDEVGNMEAKNATVDNINIINTNSQILLKESGSETFGTAKLKFYKDDYNYSYFKYSQILLRFNDNKMINLQNSNTPLIEVTDGNDTSYVWADEMVSPSFRQTSKYEEKKNFEKLENGIDIIKNIEIYKYHLKNQNEKTKKHIGFVIGNDFKYSQEVTSKNNDGVDLYSFISVCCKAIQEQQFEIENLKKEMEELKNGINRI